MFCRLDCKNIKMKLCQKSFKIFIVKQQYISDMKILFEKCAIYKSLYNLCKD